MPSPSVADPRIREEMLPLLSTSPTLAGLCVTMVTVMKHLTKTAEAATIVDDLFAACALVFLTCTYLVFVALRTTRPALAQVLARIVDALLLVGLTGMTAGAFLMVYTVW